MTSHRHTHLVLVDHFRFVIYSMAQIVVVMGVCGCGKLSYFRTTVGRALAAELRCVFGDADDWHPAANVEKMSRGVPLSDEDRLPWLQALRGLLARWLATGGCGQGVLACSALRRSYRDILVGRGKGEEEDISPYCTFVLLQGPLEVLQERMSTRASHFMPASLLASQLETLEPPSAPERSLTCPITGSVDATVASILHNLSAQ